MLRFLVAGLATVAGLVLLFVASFGEPAALLRRFDTAFPVMAQQQQPPSPPAVAPLPSPSAPPPALQQRQTALEQQVQQLQSQADQANQAVTSLNSQAQRERQELDALQQQREAAEASMAQLKAEREKAAAAQPPPAPPAPPQPAPTQLAPTKLADVAPPPANPAPPPSADVTQPALVPPASAHPPREAKIEPLHPPPVHPVPLALPPAPAPRRADDHAPPAKQAVAAAERDQSKAREPRPGVQPAGSNQMDVTLERLRREAPSKAAPAPTTDSAFEIAGGGAGANFGEPSRAAPRERLGNARAALEAGRIDDARKLLESVQLQLVFRPVTPTGDPPPSASRRAGEVAEALSMLGAGDRQQALVYIDRAMGDDSGRAPPLPQQGYAAPYDYNARR